MEHSNRPNEPFTTTCRDALTRLSDAASRYSAPEDLLGVLAAQLREFLQFDGLVLVMSMRISKSKHCS
jgi:hypothetical protein